MTMAASVTAWSGWPQPTRTERAWPWLCRELEAACRSGERYEPLLTAPWTQARAIVEEITASGLAGTRPFSRALHRSRGPPRAGHRPQIGYGELRGDGWN